MNKKHILIFLIFIIASFNVNAFYFITPEEALGLHVTALQTDYSSEMYYEDVWNSYEEGNLSGSTLANLVGYNGIMTKSLLTNDDLSRLPLSELKVLRDIKSTNTFEDGLSLVEINRIIGEKQNDRNETNNEYVVFTASKNVIKENTNKVWLLIVSFTELIIEMLNLIVYLISMYLFVFVLLELIPKSLIYMRDKILENALKKRGY